MPLILQLCTCFLSWYAMSGDILYTHWGRGNLLALKNSNKREKAIKKYDDGGIGTHALCLLPKTVMC